MGNKAHHIPSESSLVEDFQYLLQLDFEVPEIRLMRLFKRAKIKHYG